MVDPAASAGTPALLYPFGDEVVVLTDESDPDPFERLGRAAVSLTSVVAEIAGSPPPRARATVFTTTPEVERLLGQCRTNAAGDGGHFLPILLDENGQYLRQIPLKKVDPGLAAAALNPAVLAVVAATQVITARLDQLAEQIRHVGLDVKQILRKLNWAQEADIEARLRNIDDIYARGACSRHEWSTIAGDRTALATHHGEIVKELKSAADGVNPPSSLEDGWRSSDIGRLNQLIGLSCQVLQGMARWSQIYLTVWPAEELTQEVANGERRRLEDAIAAVSDALDRFPTHEIGGFWSLGRIAKGGYPKAFRRWCEANDRRHAALQVTQSAQQKLLPDPVPPLELN